MLVKIDGTGVLVRDVGPTSQVDRSLDTGVSVEQLVAAINSPELRVIQAIERQNNLLQAMLSR